MISVFKKHTILFALLLLSACSGGQTPGTSLNDPTKPDPLADITYATLEDTPLVIEYQSALVSAVFSIVTQPSFGQLLVESSGQRFTYFPNGDFSGYDRLVYSDGVSSTVVSILVSSENDYPVVIDELPRVVAQDALYKATINAFDPDNDPLIYTAQNLPQWLTLNADTGELSGTPTQNDVGFFTDIVFRVTDPFGEFAEITNVIIEVLDINDAPTINPDQFPSEMLARERRTVNVFPDDPDGEFVTVMVEPNPVLAVVVQGGMLQVTAADVNEVILVNLVVNAFDELGHVGREIIPITVLPLTASEKGKTLLGRKTGAGVHLVVLGDGYKIDQQNQFRLDVEKFIGRLKKDEGTAMHLGAWNVHMVESISVNSGIDDDVTVDYRDTYFNAGYYCSSIERLICADSLTVFETAFEEYPDFDQIVLLINDNRYGGSGGQYSIASSTYPEVAIHELGHSFAGLADEYVDVNSADLVNIEYAEGLFPNVSQSNNPKTVPWSHWFSRSDADVGIFEGAFYRPTGFYRGTIDSKMRNYEKMFGPINSEQWAIRVYETAGAVASFSPVSNSVVIASGQQQTFSVAPILGAPTQQVSWTLNGRVMTDQLGNTSFTGSLPVGRHVLSVMVEDVSGHILKAAPHAGQFIWDWEIDKQ